jgi:hypothetical protein
MRIPADRLREIENLARERRVRAMQIADSLSFENPSALDLVTTVLGPVDLVPNLTRNGRRLAGLLDTRLALPTVSCELYDPPPRQRFSAAHELGHYVLHTPAAAGGAACDQSLVDRDDDDAEGLMREAEADAFAGAFLILSDDLERAIVTFGWCAGFLAERFGVSLAAMRRRYRELATLRDA